MIWEVFRQQQEGGDFVYCRDVHAPDREMAKQYAVVQHGRRKPTHALWVVPQQEIREVAAGESVDADGDGESVDADGDDESVDADAADKSVDADGADGESVDKAGESGEWLVFSPDRMGYHTECGTVTARGGADASRQAIERFAEDDETLWVVRETAVGEVTADDVTFGGTTDKSYRFAQTYNVDPVAEEVRSSEEEQVEAERRKRGDA